MIKLIEALQPLLTLAGGGLLTLAGVWYKDRRDRHRDAQEWFRTKYIEGGIEPLHLYLVWARRYFQTAAAVHRFENIDEARDEAVRELLKGEIGKPPDDEIPRKAQKEVAEHSDVYDNMVRRHTHQMFFDMFSRREPLFFPEESLTRISLLFGEGAVRRGFLHLAYQMGLERLPGTEAIEDCLDISEHLLDVMGDLHGVLMRRTITKRSDVERMAELPDVKALLDSIEKVNDRPKRTSGEDGEAAQDEEGEPVPDTVEQAIQRTHS